MAATAVDSRKKTKMIDFFTSSSDEEEEKENIEKKKQPLVIVKSKTPLTLFDEQPPRDTQKAPKTAKEDVQPSPKRKREDSTTNGVDEHAPPPPAAKKARSAMKVYIDKNIKYRLYPPMVLTKTRRVPLRQKRSPNHPTGIRHRYRRFTAARRNIARFQGKVTGSVIARDPFKEYLYDLIAEVCSENSPVKCNGKFILKEEAKEAFIHYTEASLLNILKISYELSVHRGVKGDPSKHQGVIGLKLCDVQRLLQLYQKNGKFCYPELNESSKDL